MLNKKLKITGDNMKLKKLSITILTLALLSASTPSCFCMLKTFAKITTAIKSKQVFEQTNLRNFSKLKHNYNFGDIPELQTKTKNFKPFFAEGPYCETIETIKVDRSGSQKACKSKVLDFKFNCEFNCEEKNKEKLLNKDRFFEALKTDYYRDIIEFSKKLDLNAIKDENEKTPLEIAYDKNNLELAEFFKRYGAIDKGEENIKLFESCFKGDLENLKKILANNPKLTVNDLCTQEWKNYFSGWPFYAERSLIWLACAMGHAEIVKWLLLNCAKTDVKLIQELLSINCRFCKSPAEKRKNQATIEKYLKMQKEKQKCTIILTNLRKTKNWVKS